MTSSAESRLKAAAQLIEKLGRLLESNADSFERESDELLAAGDTAQARYLLGGAHGLRHGARNLDWVAELIDGRDPFARPPARLSVVVDNTKKNAPVEPGRKGS